ncbi:MAG: hypothetical protein JST01_18265 [Cyanobacteria bacterium SZAS TMP-1]|nr:hypothetical protein [Cyanobacteria bacterium SZAS TMP-1]
MTTSHKFVSISQLTNDGSRPMQSAIIAALFPLQPACLRGLVEDWSPVVKEQTAAVVTALMGWNPEPHRVLLVGPVGSGKIFLMHSAGRMAEAFCLRIQLTVDMPASELGRMFAQAEQHERVLIVLEHWGRGQSTPPCAHLDERLARHLDRLVGRKNTVIVVSTHDVGSLSDELRSRFGDFTIEISSVAHS